VTTFTEELKYVQAQLMGKIENFRTHEKKKCKELLSVWGRQLATDPPSITGRLLVTEATKKIIHGREKEVTEDFNGNDRIDRDILHL